LGELLSATDAESIAFLRRLDQQIARLQSLIASLPSSDASSRGSAAAPLFSEHTTRLHALREQLHSLQSRRDNLIAEVFDAPAKHGETD
jgi:transposase